MTGAYEQMQRFNRASPPSRPRRGPRQASTGPTGPAGSRPRSGPEIILHVTEDRSRKRALIRGRSVTTVLDLAVVTDRTRWSPGARGWVVHTDDLADILAMADYAGATTRVTVMKE